MNTKSLSEDELTLVKNILSIPDYSQDINTPEGCTHVQFDNLEPTYLKIVGELLYRWNTEQWELLQCQGEL